MPNLSQITKGSITWTFSQSVNTGQFANGDYWVIGPVTVTSITPTPSNGLNGSMLNPDGIGDKQGYDERLNSKIPYSASKNIALNLPLTIEEGSLLSSESLGSEFGNDHDTTRPKQIQVLTILRSEPPADALRPAYCGSSKPIVAKVSDIDFNKLANLAKPSNSPVALASLINDFSNPWIDNRKGWTGRYIHPADNMPGYGREVSLKIGDAALAVHLDYDIEEKRQLTIRLIQLGLDLFGILQNGGTSNWYADGGHASGRKWPIVFAGLMLNRLDMQQPQGSFGEDQQTFYVSENDVNLSRSSSLVPYTTGDIGMPEWGIRHTSKPNMDNKAWDAATYRLCCTATSWVGQCLAALIMNAEEIWNHQPFFDYMDRYMKETVIRGNPGWQRSWSTFASSCWDTYRTLYQLNPVGIMPIGESSDPNIRLDVISSPVAGRTLKFEVIGAPAQHGYLVIGGLIHDPIRIFGATSHIDLYQPTANLDIELETGALKGTVSIDIPPFIRRGDKVGAQAFWIHNGRIYSSRAYEITIC